MRVPLQCFTGVLAAAVLAAIAQPASAEQTFTGATESKPGRFEAADGGTLVLDEIGSLISSSQAKLLRVIEERSFERLGGKQPITIDVRIIALANIDIKQAVRARGSSVPIRKCAPLTSTG